MSNLEAVVSAHMSVSNTPLFLVRKLKEEDSVKALAKHGASYLIKHLKSSLSDNEQSFAKRAMPYAYLIALYEKKDLANLALAKTFDHESFDWYEDIIEFLYSKASFAINSNEIKAEINYSSGPANVQIKEFSE